MSPITKLDNLGALVGHLRDVLDNGIPQKDKPNKQIRYLLLFAYNGTGKTRLSMGFKDADKSESNISDTLYFNAFTEDLFSWFNDIDNDHYRVLQLNDASSFFDGLLELEMESRIGPLLERYTDLQFIIQYENSKEWMDADDVARKKMPQAPFVLFFRERDVDSNPIPIKPSRGEENIFVWCFFLSIAQIALDSEKGGAYNWVKYLFIDDPISSLDDNNAISVASHLSQLLMSGNGKIKVVISTHHTLFFNVLWNELNSKRKLQPYFLSSDPAANGYTLRYTNDSPFFHHIALLKQLHEAAESDNLYTYHFNILRNILEKTATFHGFKNFSACIKKEPNDPDGIVHARMVNVLSHGNYSLFEPTEMLPENKQYFKTILSGFMQDYRFDPALFPPQTKQNDANLEGAAQS
jgi:hypothetical protein